MAEFTGERVIPGQVDIDLWNEHIARYAFAARFAAGRRVLDAGCGAGYGSALLAETARSVTALDISAEALAFARAHYKQNNLEFLQASAAALPIAGASIDFAVAFEMIEHLEDWRAFLSEVRRVMAPGAAFIVSTPNLAYYTESRGATGPNPFHFHEFEYEEFERELRGVFPHVSMFLENHVEGIGFHPAACTAGPPELEAAESRPSPHEAHFFVAVCSLAPQDRIPGFVYLPAAANVLRERERHIQMLESDIAGLRNDKQHLVEMFRKLNEDLDKSNQWARDLDEKLRAAQARIVELQEEERRQTESYQQELGRCIELLDKAENTVIERTAWAKDLETKLNLLKGSLWVKAGRAAGIVKLPRA